MEPERPFDNTLEAPVILDRGHHRISRRDIDADCPKVLYRLSNHGFAAYLVGGAVRDLLLDRKPADFDVRTNAHPNQIKKLFRNAYLIGRRFRLAQVRFQGGKIIEVSTFRRKPTEEELAAEREEEARLAREAELRELAAESEGPSPPDFGEDSAATEETTSDPPTREDVPGPEAGQEPAPDDSPEPQPGDQAGPGQAPRRARSPLKPITYGTPREDAFRRDLTINALFYDIATFSVIDYVGGLADLRAGLVRIIGDPDTSYTEDPVRIWRVLRHASRLGFAIEDGTAAAIERHGRLLAASSGARL